MGGHGPPRSPLRTASAKRYKCTNTLACIAPLRLQNMEFLSVRKVWTSYEYLQINKVARDTFQKRQNLVNDVQCNVLRQGTIA